MRWFGWSLFTAQLISWLNFVELIRDWLADFFRLLFTVSLFSCCRFSWLDAVRFCEEEFCYQESGWQNANFLIVVLWTLIFRKRVIESSSQWHVLLSPFYVIYSHFILTNYVSIKNCLINEEFQILLEVFMTLFLIIS